jgi:hypothetical protein
LCFHFVSEVSRRVLLAKTQFAATPRVLKPPDPAVEIPDFHIAGVQELACGPQGLRVRFGVDLLYDATRLSALIR